MLLKNIYTGKHICWSLFFNTVADLRSTTLLKKWPQHRCFPVNFSKFLRTPPGNCFCNFLVFFCVYFSNMHPGNFMKFSHRSPLSNYEANIKPLSADPTKWSNTLKQFVVKSRQIVWICLTILWGLRLKG